MVASLLWAGTFASAARLACPSGDAVATELDHLGASAALAALGSPGVTVEGTKMRIVLRGWDGAIMGAREVAAPDACHERASVAAVFIAAWVGAWSVEDANDSKPPSPISRPSGIKAASLPILPLPSSQSLPTGMFPPAHSPPPATPSAAPPPAPQAVTTHSAAEQPLSPRNSASSRRGRTTEVAGLAFGTHDGNAVAFGAGVLAAYRLWRTLAVAALLETTGERETTLGPALAVYRTSRLGLGSSLLRQGKNFFADVGIFPELTMLTVDGRHLAVARNVTTWGAAMDVRGRLGFAAGRFVPFLYAGGSGALRAQRLTLDDLPQATMMLSRWNVSAGAGLAILWGASE